MSDEDVRLTRKNAILAARETQIVRNLLSVDGGADYIAARLVRAPCESDTSWSGNKSLGIVGRTERAYCVPYAGRIFDTLTEQIFGRTITRDGADEEWAADASQTGLSVDKVMQEALTDWISGGWCWLGVDRGPQVRDAEGNVLSVSSRSQREASGDRVFWTVYKPTDVVDWAHDRAGRLLWLITETSYVTADDPAKEPVITTLRTIWGRGEGTRLYIVDDKLDHEEPFTFSCDEVPFVLMGVPASGAHWFDNVEAIQAALLNLESLHHENLTQTVYPQLVMPAAILDKLFEKVGTERNAYGLKRVIELVRGLNYPLFEDTADSGISRYLTPSSQDLGAIPTEITRLRAALFETAGLSLARLDSRQAETAQSKMLNRVDAEAGLRFIAGELQDVETAAVALSVKFDREFAEYTPQYPTQFGITDAAALTAAMTQFEQLPIAWPDSMKLEAARVFLDALPGVSDERKAEILGDFEESIGDEADAVAQIANGGEPGQGVIRSQGGPDPDAASEDPDA